MIGGLGAAPALGFAGAGRGLAVGVVAGFGTVRGGVALASGTGWAAVVSLEPPPELPQPARTRATTTAGPGRSRDRGSGARMG